MYRILVLATIAQILGILTITTDILLFTLLFVGGLTFYCLFFLSTSFLSSLLVILSSLVWVLYSALSSAA
jgi:hypothetical protein